MLMTDQKKNRTHTTQDSNIADKEKGIAAITSRYCIQNIGGISVHKIINLDGLKNESETKLKEYADDKL